MMISLLCFALVLTLTPAQGFRFTAPPFLASFGDVYATSFRARLPYKPIDFFKRNFSVFIPPDYIGCNPVPVPSDTAVWVFMPAPCGSGGNGYQVFERSYAWQQAGAEALLISSTVGITDQVTAHQYSGNWGLVTIPTIAFRYLKNFYYDTDPTTNPDVSIFVGLFIPGFNNITVTLEPVDSGIVYRQLFTTGSTWSGIQWTSWTMSLVAMFLAAVKLGM